MLLRCVKTLRCWTPGTTANGRIYTLAPRALPKKTAAAGSRSAIPDFANISSRRLTISELNFGLSSPPWSPPFVFSRSSSACLILSSTLGLIEMSTDDVDCDAAASRARFASDLTRSSSSAFLCAAAAHAAC